MPHGNKWLIALWKREWNRCRKDWLMQVYTEVICVVAVCVVFILKKVDLNAFAAYILDMPAAVYAFWGIAPGAETGKAAFYIQWMLVPLHIWMAWRICVLTVRSVWTEEEQGSIYYLCNQWYSRQEMAIAKYLWNVVSFIVNYSILFALCAVLAGNGWGRGRLAVFFLKGAFIMVMLLSLSYCYAVISERKSRCYLIDILLFGTLAAGNLYKFRDLIILLLQRSNRNYAGIYRFTGWLAGLKWLSPLSWLNPFTEPGVKSMVIQIIICLAVTAGSAVLGILGYRIRKFE